jgi:type II secretory pathway pseudopilin PulG
MRKVQSALILAAVTIAITGAALFKPTIDPKVQDAQRMKDMHSLASALDAYYREHKEYPTTPAGVDCASEFNTAVGLDTSLVPAYINRIPKDPNPVTCDRNYQYASDRTSFVLLAHLDTLGGRGNQWCVAATGGPQPEVGTLLPCP